MGEWYAFEREKIYYEFLVRFTEEGLWQLPEMTEVFEESGIDSLKRLVVNRLKPLYDGIFEELLTERISQHNPLGGMDLRRTTRREREKAAAEVRDRLIRMGEIGLFAEYPLLYEMHQKIHENCIRMIRLLAIRLREDAGEIGRLFFGQDDPGKIKEVISGGGDSYLHGNTTLRLVTDCGSFFYKPHDCEAGLFYREMVERYFSDITYVPRILAGDGYGFVEAVARRPLSGKEGLSLYYRHFGGLTAVFRLLGSRDMHCGNMIAVGDRPVAVDLEMILSPVEERIGEGETADALKEDYLFSVSGCAVLPSVLVQGRQISPLYDAGEETACLPVWDRKAVSVDGYEQDFLEGFTEIYERCLGLKDELAGYLDRLCFSVRYVLRDAEEYSGILRNLHTGNALRREEEQQRILREYILKDRGSRETEAVGRWEVACLLEGDVPYCYVPADSRDLYGEPGDGRLMTAFFGLSAAENMAERLERLSPTELRFELEYISSRLSHAQILFPYAPKYVPSSPFDRDILRPGEALAEAEEIFEKTDAQAIHTPSGIVTWLSGHRRETADYSYNYAVGSAGLAVFFGRLADMTESDRIRARCEEHCERICGDISNLATRLAEKEEAGEQLVFGLYNGMGGLLRSLYYLRGGHMRKLAEETAARLIRLIHSRDLTDQMEKDVANGLAGLLVGLEPWYRIFGEGKTGGARTAGNAGTESLMLTIRSGKAVYTGDEIQRRIRRLATVCGDWLSERQILRTVHGFPVWDTRETGRGISGFGHGMAGIGYALYTAWKMSDTLSFEGCAKDAFFYEDLNYSRKLGGWPDPRNQGKNAGTMCGLCAGSAGLALGALAVRRDFPEMEGLLETALASSVSHPLLEKDYVCCGNASRVDVFLSAGEELGDDSWILYAGSLLSSMVKRKREKGDYTVIDSRFRNYFDPSLIYGCSGIGYELLRYAALAGEP